MIKTIYTGFNTNNPMPVRLTDSDVESILEEIIGKNAFLVLKACEVGRTDEQISKITKLDLQTIRSLLNQLHTIGLITYTREKDEEHNWFKYTWYARKDMIVEVIKHDLEESIKDLQNKLDFETSYMFFACKRGCTKVPFEIAVEYDFKCPECGGDLNPYDNSKDIRRIKHELDAKMRLLRKIERYEKTKAREARKATSKKKKKPEKSKKSKKKVEKRTKKSKRKK